MPRPNVTYDISTKAGRAQAEHYMYWSDHGLFRTRFWNWGQVADDVFRSNHPDPARLSRYHDMGIKAVLNLRGTAQKPPFMLESDACATLGLELHSVALRAREPAFRDSFLDLFAAFDRIPRPFVLHCKSGADRAGLASAMYLLDQGASVDLAARQLSARHLHLKFTKTGVQDHMLKLYAARSAESPISIRDWVRDEYDPDALAASFGKTRFLPV